MCRNIHALFNVEPPATEDEVRSAALQYVRKISGFTKPSRANEAAFTRAVDDVAGRVAAVARRARHLRGGEGSRGRGGTRPSPRREALRYGLADGRMLADA